MLIIFSNPKVTGDLDSSVHDGEGIRLEWIRAFIGSEKTDSFIVVVVLLERALFIVSP